jgi:hypothetical protein
MGLIPIPTYILTIILIVAVIAGVGFLVFAGIINFTQQDKGIQNPQDPKLKEKEEVEEEMPAEAKGEEEKESD